MYASASILFHKTDGSEWAEQRTLGYVNASWGSSPEDLYAVVNYGETPTVYHSTGDGEWDPQASPMVSLRDISGTARDHVFAAGGPSVFFSRGDGVWTAQLTVEDDALNAVWAAGSETVYACTQNGMVYRSNGAGSWSEAQPLNPGGISRSCYAIWGTGPDNVYIGTIDGKPPR